VGDPAHGPCEGEDFAASEAHSFQVITFHLRLTPRLFFVNSLRVNDRNELEQLCVTSSAPCP